MDNAKCKMQNATCKMIGHCEPLCPQARFGAHPQKPSPGDGGFKIANTLAILKTDEGCRAVILWFRIWFAIFACLFVFC